MYVCTVFLNRLIKILQKNILFYVFLAYLFAELRCVHYYDIIQDILANELLNKESRIKQIYQIDQWHT